jgi:hypothetical protein
MALQKLGWDSRHPGRQRGALKVLSGAWPLKGTLDRLRPPKAERWTPHSPTGGRWKRGPLSEVCPWLILTPPRLPLPPPLVSLHTLPHPSKNAEVRN